MGQCTSAVHYVTRAIVTGCLQLVIHRGPLVLHITSTVLPRIVYRGTLTETKRISKTHLGPIIELYFIRSYSEAMAKLYK